MYNLSRHAAYELGDKADAKLDPLAEEANAAIASNADQAKEKHSTLVSKGTDKAHNLTDVR